MENQENISEDNSMGIIAYCTFIGLIIAFISNKDKKDAFVSYHIRQSLGLNLAWIACIVVSILPFIGLLIYVLGTLGLFVLWIFGLINAINKKQEPTPILGEKFEEWFKNI